MEIVIGLVILYVIQFVLIYSMTFGYFEGRYPNMGNRTVAMKIAVLGGLLPLIGPLLVLNLSDWAKHGLRWK